MWDSRVPPAIGSTTLPCPLILVYTAPARGAAASAPARRTRKCAPFFLCAHVFLAPDEWPNHREVGTALPVGEPISMPRRTDIQSILIIGAGPIVIGQACEFDYSGTQACKALKAEGYRIVLVNSNPATIMTDPDLADATYIEPITPEIVAKIIAKERPDALLPTMGGQTALNTALSLNKMGVLERFNVKMIGATARGHRQGRGSQAVPRGDAADRARDPALAAGQDAARRAAGARRHRPARDHPAVVHARRHRRRHRLQQSGVHRHRRARHRRLPDQRGADRGIGARLEGIRDGGRSRPQRQLHHYLLDREPRPDGRAHRRLRSPSRRRSP